jgi:hypothetical protein
MWMAGVVVAVAVLIGAALSNPHLRGAMVRWVSSTPLAALFVDPGEKRLLAPGEPDPGVRPSGPAARPMVAGEGDKSPLEVEANLEGPRPVVELERPKVDSAGAGLSGEQIARALGSSQKAFEACLAEALRRDPTAVLGKVRITLTIHPSGLASGPVVGTRSVDQSELGECLKSACKHTAFPRFEGEPFAAEIPLVLGRAF